MVSKVNVQLIKPNLPESGLAQLKKSNEWKVRSNMNTKYIRILFRKTGNWNYEGPCCKEKVELTTLIKLRWKYISGKVGEKKINP